MEEFPLISGKQEDRNFPCALTLISLQYHPATMSLPDNVDFDFDMLEAEPIGNNTVVFRLSDGAQVKIRVDIDRAGIANNYRNPDGTPHYAVSTNLKLTFIPKDRKFTLSRTEVTKGVPALRPNPQHIG